MLFQAQLNILLQLADRNLMKFAFSYSFRNDYGDFVTEDFLVGQGIMVKVVDAVVYRQVEAEIFKNSCNIRAYVVGCQSHGISCFCFYYHSFSYCLTMRYSKGTQLFYAVTYRMTEIQQLPKTSVPFIGLHDRLFDRYASFYNMLKIILLNKRNQVSIGNESTLCCFSSTFKNVFLRQELEGSVIAQNQRRLPVCTYKVFSTEKIDGAVATIMALDRAIRCGNDGGASVYDERGLLFL